MIIEGLEARLAGRPADFIPVQKCNLLWMLTSCCVGLVIASATAGWNWDGAGLSVPLFVCSFALFACVLKFTVVKLCIVVGV